MAWLDRRAEEMSAGMAAFGGGLRIMEDPEAIFQEGWLRCDVGDHDGGLERLAQAVAKGYTVAPVLAASPVFDRVRGRPEFQALLATAAHGRGLALQAFRDGGGELLLSVRA
jgi:hypothetical protein